MPLKEKPVSLYIPPQNVDAEQAILGSILKHSEYLYEVIDQLSPDVFYKTAHQYIFQAFAEMFEKKQEIDLITVSNKLRESDKLVAIGGAAYLTELIDYVPVASNIIHYANIVKDKAMKRGLLTVCNNVSSSCYDDKKPAEDSLLEAQNGLFGIRSDEYRKDFVSLQDSLSDGLDTVNKLYANEGNLYGLKTGFIDFDKILSGLHKSDLILLAGRPAMGKTSFALNIAKNVAALNDISVAIFSLEMDKKQLVLRLMCSEAKIGYSNIMSGFISKQNTIDITNAAAQLANYDVQIDDTPDITTMDIRMKSRRLAFDKNIGLIIIDYLQLIKTNERKERRDLDVGDISRSLKILAKELNVPVIALSQLSRKPEERSDKRPMLSDLRDSGALEQDADVVAFIYRDEIYNKDENNPNRGKAEIIIAKQRNGPVGFITLNFNSKLMTFENYTNYEDNLF